MLQEIAKLDPTVIKAVLELVKALVWPAIVALIFVLYRKEITPMISRLVVFKIAGTECVFDRVESLQAELTKTNSVVSRLGEASKDPELLEATNSLPKPDGNLVAKWAAAHGADNPWDMGPKNWERCLFDLNCPGGKPNKLVVEHGKLKYQ